MKCFILEPLCHGNGGWCGVETLKECKTIKEALEFIPETEPHPSPYGGHIINHPRISRTKDPNKPIYVWNFDSHGWRYNKWHTH